MVVVPFNGTLVAAKRLVMTSGFATLRVAAAASPVMLLDVTGVVKLFLVPGVVPVTLTENVHVVAGASVAPATETRLDPALALIVASAQLPFRTFGVATTNPAGRLSLKPSAVSVP